MEFRPPHGLGAAVGVGVVVINLLAAGLVGFRLLEMPISLSSLPVGLTLVLLVGVAILFSYWSYAAYGLRYRIEQNLLTIRWGFTQQLVPLPSIERLVPGQDVTGPVKVEGINWPGCHVGRGLVEGVGDTVFYSGHRSQDELLFVVTPALAYGLSVAERHRFEEELARQKELEALGPLAQAALRGPWVSASFWSDRGVWVLIALTLLVNLLLWVAILYTYPSLPELLPLKLSPLGEVGHIGWRIEILYLPLFGLAILAINSVLAFFMHPRERGAALFCLSAALFMQFLLVSASFSVLV